MYFSKLEWKVVEIISWDHGLSKTVFHFNVGEVLVKLQQKNL